MNLVSCLCSDLYTIYDLFDDPKTHTTMDLRLVRKERD